MGRPCYPLIVNKIIICTIIGWGLVACKVPSSNSESLPNTPVSSEKSNIGGSSSMPYSIPSQPFDETSFNAVKDYYIYLLQTGNTLDYGQSVQPDSLYALTVESCNYSYRASVFNNLNIKVDSCKEITYGSYELTLDIPVNTTGILKSGKQMWYMTIAWPPYGDVLSVELVHESKRQSIKDGKTDKIESLRNSASINTTFSNPSSIPSSQRINYLLANAPPSGQLETGGTYLTQQDVNIWSKRIFGEPLLENHDSQFYIDSWNGRQNIYSFFTGWTPPIELGRFIYRDEQEKEILYYYEIYAPEYVSLHTLPRQVLCYTIKDDIIWSCRDITSEYGCSPYWESQKYHKAP